MSAHSIERPVPDVVVVGAASRDIAPDDARGWRLGGGVTYGSLTLGRLGLSVGAVVGVDEAAAAATELGLLREAGVDIRLVPLERGPVFENIERPTGRVQLAVSASDRIVPRSLPVEWRAAGGWFLAPVAEELDDEWADAIPPEALLAIGWQGLLREVATGEQVRRRAPRNGALVGRADLIGVSRDDLDPGVAIRDLVAMLRPGGTLALTRAARGGITFVGDAGPTHGGGPTDGAGGPTHGGGPNGSSGPTGSIRMWRWPSIAADAIVDPTGAGDVFLATLLGARLERRLVRGRLDRHLDLRLAAAAASLVLERPGLLGVPERASLRARVARMPSSG